MLKYSFPKKPGVYWFLNKSLKVLYVGKAKNLNQRLKSYKRLDDSSPKTLKMLEKAKTVKYKVLDSELEALLVESELIKLHQPFYNFRLKDDKSPLYIYITNDQYPKVKTGRKENLSKYSIKKFNQFGPFPSGYKTKQVLKFSRKVFGYCNSSKKNNKACFYYHLDLCPGACTGKVTPSEYRQNISNLKIFLRGKKKRLISNLKKDMLEESKQKNFEKAAIIRDQLLALDSLAQAHVLPELELPQLEHDLSKNKLLYLKRILKKHSPVPVNFPLTRIEGYDVSNLQGKNPTSSMVVFKNTKPQKDQYRIFKIRSLSTPNDYHMLKETFKRRFNHSEWQLPNLIIIDGGKPQLKAGLLTIPINIPIVSISKNPDRLLIPNRQARTITTIVLDPKNPATKLIQSVRDESHRFAKALHLKLRRKLI